MTTSFAAIQRELASRKSATSQLRREMSYDEDMIVAPAVWGDQRMRRFFNGLSAEAKLKITSLAWDIVKAGVDQFIIGEDPAVRVMLPPSAHRDSKLNEEHAKELEEALMALTWQMGTFSTESPLYEMAQHTLGLGLGIVSYPIVRRDRHPMKNDRGKYRKPEGKWTAKDRKAVSSWDQRTFMALPFDPTAVHPRSAYFDIHHDPPEDMLVETSVIPSVYIDRCPHLGDFNSSARTAKLLMYCSPDEYGLWLSGQPLLTSADGANSEGIAPNRTGIMWYRMARSGFGWKDYENRWENRIQGVVRGARAAIVAKMLDFNIMDVIRTVYGLPPIGIEGQSDEEAQEAASRFVFGMAQIWWHKAGVKQHKIDVPEIPSIVLDQMRETDQAIEFHTWPEVLRGVYKDDTATGSAQRLSQGQRSLRLPKRNIEQAYEGMLQDICHMVKHELQEPLTLLSKNRGLVTLDPDDIVDGMRILIDLAPATAEERAFERREQLALKDAGLRSAPYILTADPDITDAEEELAQIYADRAFETEVIQTAIAQEAAQRVLGTVAPTAEPVPGPTPLAAPSENVGGGAAVAGTGGLMNRAKVYRRAVEITTERLQKTLEALREEPKPSEEYKKQRRQAYETLIMDYSEEAHAAFEEAFPGGLR